MTKVTIIKTPEEHNLQEINDILVQLDVQPRKRIDHALKALNILVEDGRVVVKTKAKLKVVGKSDAQPAAKEPEPAKEKKIKPLRTPKSELQHDWVESHYDGRQVYTGYGTGIVTGEAVTDGSLYYKVKLIHSKKTVASPDKSTRFTAVNDGYRENYVKEDEIRTASGAKAIHKGDDFSYAMRGASLACVREIAQENGIEDKYDEYVKRKLNPGMVRMNIGLILRGRLRRGEKVTILGTEDLAKAAEKMERRYQERVWAEKDQTAAEPEAQPAKAKRKK